MRFVFILWLFFKYFFGVPHLATCIFLFFYNEPELGVGIDPGMVWHHFHLALDGDWTHDLLIVSQVLYHYTTAFAYIVVISNDFFN